MKNEDLHFSESCRRFIKTEVNNILRKRDIAVLKLTKRQNEYEQRLVELEAQRQEPTPKKIRPVRITGASLISFRKRVCITQRQLACLLGTTAAAVCNWESGSRKLSPGYRSKFLELRVMKKKAITERVKSFANSEQK